ncbi:hypothetical protein B0G83_110160 [Paraburkholderia sp. BL21I4N1]|nr:hypothetical protein B0G83_110160 [Paraburkholderia sp. BL21I4N1]
MNAARAWAPRRWIEAASRRACDQRTSAGEQDEAAALQPMPHEDVPHERENAFID